MKNCLMYKLCYYRFWEVHSGYNKEPGYDTVRRAVIGVRRHVNRVAQKLQARVLYRGLHLHQLDRPNL